MSNIDNVSYTFSVQSSKLSATGVTFYELTYSVANSDNCETSKETIWRRYSEVRDLYKILSRRFSCVKLSSLPKGSYLDRFKTEVIESRRQNICNFLQDISQSESIIQSKEFSDFLIHSARRSSLPSFGRDKLFLPKKRNTTLNEASTNPLFSTETSFKSSKSFQESERDISSSHEHTTDILNTGITSPEIEQNSSSNKSTNAGEDTYISPYQSLSYSQHGFDSETENCFSNELNVIESIGSGSDESYQGEVELHSINPLTLDTIMQPVTSDTDNVHNTELDDFFNDPPITDDIHSNATAQDDTPTDGLIDNEWWDSVVDDTENALKELEKQTKQHSKSRKQQQKQKQSLHSMYETLPLDSSQTHNIIQEELPCPNPVNISNSEDTAITGFEGVTRGGELYAAGIELCKEGQLEEGLNLLEKGIELFFDATRNKNLDANYRKKLRSSLKQYLTYAEQVKTQLNERSLQGEASDSIPMRQTDNTQVFRIPITLDELRVIRIVKGRFLLVQSSKNIESGQHPFLLKTVQKSKINYVDARHRHVRMSRNLLHSSPHPNILQLLGSVQSSHLIYLMLEYVEGRDLSQISADYYRGDLLQSRSDDFIRWTTQLISTLEELHALGVFYLHLCPWDVIVTDNDNSIKLTYPIRWEDLPDRLQDPKTLPYVALECTHPITPVFSESADWWSLGTICYELITGQKFAHTHPDGFREGKTIFFPSRCFAQSPLTKEHVCSLVSQLLTFNSTERMHYVNSIKQHPIFNNVNWGKLRTNRFNLQEKHF